MGKVEGQFKELKEKGIVTAFDCAKSPDSRRVKKRYRTQIISFTL